MPVFDSEFVKKLAGYATPVIEPRVLTAAKEDNEVLDQACQSAVAYWMLGWHEDEIESVLEDEGFPEKIVERAMEELHDYAEEIIEGGPFALFEYGQLIKLNNGQSGVLVKKNKHLVELQIGSDMVQIFPEQIDLRATANLTKAYQMRKQAAEKLSLIAQRDPGYSYKTIKIDPSEVERNFPPKYKGITPEGTPVKLVDVSAVKDVLGSKIEKTLAMLLDLQVEYDKTKEELDELKEEYKSRIAPIQQKESEQLRMLKDEVDKVFNAIVELEAVTDEQYALAYELWGRFVILQQRVEPPVSAEPKNLEELRAYYTKWNEFIDSQTGKLAQQLKRANEEIKQESLKIKQPYLQRIFGIFFPTKERRGHLAQESWISRMWTSFTDWVASIWQGAQDIYSGWTNQLKPEGESQLAQMDELLEETKAAQERAEAQTAVESVVSASTRRW